MIQTCNMVHALMPILNDLLPIDPKSQLLLDIDSVKLFISLNL
jgi:hypothetical protein